MAHLSPSTASLVMPTTGEGDLVFLRDGPTCWALLFSTRGAARAYRLAVGLTDNKRGNWFVSPSEGMASALQQRFASAGHEVVGALLDPVTASPQSGTLVSIDQLLEWADDRAGVDNPLRSLTDRNWTRSCHLVAYGDAAVAFVADLALVANDVWPSWPAADGSEGDPGGFAVAVSSADGGDIGGQVADALRLLRDNRAELARLAGLPGVTLTLSFVLAGPKVIRQGVNTRYIISPCYFPPELIQLAAEVGMGIAVHVQCEITGDGSPESTADC
jgi:hypothetical protein